MYPLVSKSGLIVSLAGVIRSRLMPTKLCKLMFASYQKKPLARKDLEHKGISLLQLRAPLA